MTQTTSQTRGWTTAGADAEGLSSSRLSQMDETVRAGTFKKITSILIARHGQLVHESYFGQTNRDSLQNPRSASKTVISILVGIAIDRGLIPGVDTRVFSFFQDKLPVQCPDPRKERITIPGPVDNEQYSRV